MKIRTILLSGTAIILATTVQAAKRPNILFIHMEDMGIQIPAYGDNTVATPNLDKLASEGVVFNSARVTAATCAASRGSLFSGLYPHQNGVMAFVQDHGFYLRPGIPTFVTELQKAGYTTGITYKTGVESSHYSESPVPFDFQPNYTENYLTGQIKKDAPKEADKPPLVSFSVDNFKYFLENLEEGKPFYFQAQTPDTHHPWDRPTFIREGDPDWPYPAVDESKIQSVPGWGDTIEPDAKLRHQIAEYYGAIQRVDWFVGRILALLKEYGHADDTLVIFSSDHGPSHFLKGKTTASEFGLQVPFIARWPGVMAQPDSHSDALVSFVDLFPTFVDVAGMDIPNYLPGHSLVPVFKGEPSNRQHLYSAYVGHTTGLHLYWPTRTVSDGHWKLTHQLFGDGVRKRYAEGNASGTPALWAQLRGLPKGTPAKDMQTRNLIPVAIELYDLDKDPYETENLIDDPQYADARERLTKQLESWQTSTSDPFADEAFVKHFSEVYKENYDIWKNLGGFKMKDPNALDFSEFIRPWDPAPYIGKKDL